MYRMLMLVVNEIRSEVRISAQSELFLGVMRTLIVVGWHVAHLCCANPAAANIEWFHFDGVRRL